eukprot:gene836-1629_t
MLGITSSRAIKTFSLILIITSAVLGSEEGNMQTKNITVNQNQKNIRIDNLLPNLYKDLPKTSMSMNDLKIFFNLLRRNISFGFAHFNDGEVHSMSYCPEGKIIDSGWQNCSTALSRATLEAMTNIAPNFYVGIPCHCEFDGIPFFKALKFLNISHSPSIQPAKKLKSSNDSSTNTTRNNIQLGQNINNNNDITNSTHKSVNDSTCPSHQISLHFPPNSLHRNRLTLATVFINGNFNRAHQLLPMMLNYIMKRGRGVHVITGAGHHTERLKFPIKSVYFAAKTHAFDINYHEMRTLNFLNERYKPGDVILLMLGPLGRILASEWCLLTSSMTFIDLVPSDMDIARYLNLVRDIPRVKAFLLEHKPCRNIRQTLTATFVDSSPMISQKSNSSSSNEMQLTQIARTPTTAWNLFEQASPDYILLNQTPHKTSKQGKVRSIIN